MNFTATSFPTTLVLYTRQIKKPEGRRKTGPKLWLIIWEGKGKYPMIWFFFKTNVTTSLQEVIVTTTAGDFDKWIRPLAPTASFLIPQESYLQKQCQQEKKLSPYQSILQSGALVKNIFREDSEQNKKNTFWISFPEYFFRLTIKTNSHFSIFLITCGFPISPFWCVSGTVAFVLYTSVTRYQPPPTRHSYTLLEERRKEEGETDIYDMHLPPPFFGYMCRVYVSPTFCKWTSGMIFFAHMSDETFCCLGGNRSVDERRN